MKLIVFILLLIIASSAGAEIYRWRDERGVYHYSNSVDDVPLRYRDAVKSMNYDQNDKAGSVSQQGATTASQSAMPASVQNTLSAHRIKVRHRSIHSRRRYDDDE